MSSGGGLGGAAAGDLYAVLSVSPTATKEDIKASFRRLVKKLHPDINPGDTVRVSKHICCATVWTVLVLVLLLLARTWAPHRVS